MKLLSVTSSFVHFTNCNMISFFRLSSLLARGRQSITRLGFKLGLGFRDRLRIQAQLGFRVEAVYRA